MTFVYVSGRQCLDFAGTLKHRRSAREELLTEPDRLSEWAVQAGLLDADITVTEDKVKVQAFRARRRAVSAST
jgi:hypothetical protein